MTAPIAGLVSVLMLVRDRLDYTRKALESLAATDRDLECVIVDNGSSAPTRDFLDQWQAQSRFPVDVIRCANDAGGSTRRNLAAARAHGEYLFFVDNDVDMDDPKLIGTLAAELADHPEVAAVSPLLLYPGEGIPIVQCAGGASTRDGKIGLFGRGEHAGARFRVSREQTWAPTAALLIRRTSFARAGGFDPAFDPISLCEDVDLCCRMRAAGEHIRYVGSVSLRHYEGTTFNHLGYDKLGVWKRHTRVLRARWAEVFASGPAHHTDELVWRPVVKDYRDPARPRVRVAEAGERTGVETTFFASHQTLVTDTRRPDVRVGVIGCGQVALRGALPALAATQRADGAPSAAPFLNFGEVPGVRVTGLADPDVGALVTARRWYDVPHAVRDARELLDTVPLEGVVVCTPPHLHTKLVLDALALGLPVLVEKPVAVSNDQLDTIIAALTGRPKLEVVVNLPWGYHEGVQGIRSMIASGAFGDVRQFDVCFEHGGPQAWAPGAPWYDSLTGGVVADLAPHALDVVRRILGGVGVEVRAAAVQGVSPRRARADVLVDGCAGMIELGWDAEAPRFHVTVSGEKATLDLDLVPFRPKRLIIDVDQAGSRSQVEIPADDAVGPQGPYGEFVAALHGGPPPATRLAKVEGILRATIAWIDATRSRARNEWS